MLRKIFMLIGIFQLTYCLQALTILNYQALNFKNENKGSLIVTYLNVTDNIKFSSLNVKSFNENSNIISETNFSYNSNTFDIHSVNHKNQKENYNFESIINGNKIITNAIYKGKAYQYEDKWSYDNVYFEFIPFYLGLELKNVLSGEIAKFNVYSPLIVFMSKNLIKFVPFKVINIKQLDYQLNNKNIPVNVITIKVDNFFGVRLIPADKSEYTLAYDNSGQLIYYISGKIKYQIVF